MNRKYKIKGRFVAMLIAALLTACVVSGAVFAASVTSGSTTNKQAAASGNASDSDSELLSSEDWNALFNTSSMESSEPSSDAAVLASPLGNGMSKDSIFIWGCVAVGIGILGIAFFIYSQFIYKHMKKPVENNQPDSADQSNELPAMPKRGASYQEQVKKDQSEQEETKSIEQENQEKTDANTDEVDWDQFFEDHKNQTYKDE